MSQDLQTVDAQIETALAVVPKDKTAIALGERGLAFENAAELYRICDALVKGGVAPKGSTAGGAMASMLKGRALGLDEITSLTNITVVNGRVQIGGALILALVRKHQACAEGPTYWWEGEGNKRAAFVRARRVDEREAVTHRFGMDDAARAGLLSKDSYKAWPDEMLLWRGIARMGRLQFSDVLAGVYVPGEVQEDLAAAAPASPGPTSEPPPVDPLLEELSGDGDELPLPEAAVPAVPAIVEAPAPIVEPPAAEASVQTSAEPPPAREPGEDLDEAPFSSHAEADRAIAAAEAGQQGALFEGPAKASHVDTRRGRRRLEE